MIGDSSVSEITKSPPLNSHEPSALLSGWMHRTINIEVLWSLISDGDKMVASYEDIADLHFTVAVHHKDIF